MVRRCHVPIITSLLAINQKVSMTTQTEVSVDPFFFWIRIGSRHFPLSFHNQLGLIHYFAWCMIILKKSFETITNPNKIIIVICMFTISKIKNDHTLELLFFIYCTYFKNYMYSKIWVHCILKCKLRVKMLYNTTRAM